MILKAADLVWRVAELQPGARGCFQGYSFLAGCDGSKQFMTRSGY
jgi:hypothetical protein